EYNPPLETLVEEEISIIPATSLTEEWINTDSLTLDQKPIIIEKTNIGIDLPIELVEKLEVADAPSHEESQMSNPTKKKLTVSHPSTRNFTEWLLDKKQLHEYSTKKKKRKKKSQIQISAKKSITPSDEIISESLAKILLAQGHLLDAKKMFKKLMHKYPEKRELYEVEIKNINQLM
ncbi:MAG: hypothetical protein WAT79_01125, partial [Saprospiraceae bacterium]